MDTHLEAMNTLGNFTGYELTRFDSIWDYEEEGDGSKVILYDFDYALLPKNLENITWAGGMYLDSELRVQGINGGGQFAVKYLNGDVVSTAFMGNEFVYSPDFSDEDKAWAKDMISSALKLNSSVGTPLNAEQIAQINEAFSPILYDRQGNPIGTNPWSCFFTSYYDNVRNLNFEEFMYYFPGDGSKASESEFEALKSVDVWPFKEVETLGAMPVPVHKYPARLVNLVLGEYAGITTDDLDTSKVAYLAEYDAYYNYTSDYGPGMFVCTRGETEGDIVRLYEETPNGTDMLTLRKNGTNYRIISHQRIEG